MEDNIIPTARKKELVVEELSNSNEVLIYDLERHKALCLNYTAAEVWKLCDGNSSVSSITKALNAEPGIQVDEDVVWYALDQLSKNHLLEERPTVRRRLSRREMLKKAGTTAALVLPVVTSIVAPMAAQAQSCSTLLQPSGPSCCPGLSCVQVPLLGCHCDIVGIPC